MKKPLFYIVLLWLYPLISGCGNEEDSDKVKPLEKIVWTGTNSTSFVGHCSGLGAVSGKALNGEENRQFSQDSEISFKAEPAGLIIYSDENCSQEITGQTAKTGTYGPAAVYGKTTDTPAIYTVTASVSGFEDATTLVTLRRDIMSLGLNPASVAANECGSLTVTALDKDRGLLSLGVETSIQIASSAESIKFYSDLSCLSEISEFSLPTGSSGLVIYFKATGSGSHAASFEITTVSRTTSFSVLI